MSTMSEKTGLCLQVEESLAEVLEGSAAAALYEHIGDCDACFTTSATRAATCGTTPSAPRRS
jgi:hypothetical protein